MLRSPSLVPATVHPGLPAPAADRIRVAGFFPGLGSRALYRDLPRSFLDSAVPEVAGIYREAARALGFPARPELLLLESGSLPEGRLELQGRIGAALLVHSLAVDAHLRDRIAKKGGPAGFVAYTGESFGILTAAVASGALSVFDGVKIAQVFTPLMLRAAGGPDVDDDFARTVEPYLDEAARRAPLVGEPHHVVAVKAPTPEALADVLAEVRAVFPLTDVEVHKTYAPTQANLYVRSGVKSAFDALVASATAWELKEPTVFLAHSARMRPARNALARFIDDQGIRFADPRVPVVSNHDKSLLTTAAAVRDGVLAMTDRVMASRDTCETLTGLDADLVLELGLGRKSVDLVRDNAVATPVTACSGSRDDVDTVLRALDVASAVRSRLEELSLAGEEPTRGDYGLLHEVFGLAAGNAFCDGFFSHVFERVISAEMLRPDRAASPAFHRFLELYQHTRSHREHLNLDQGELALRARTKKGLAAGDPAPPGQAYVELTVRDLAGGVRARTVPTTRPEVVVFCFGGASGRSAADHVVRQHELFETLARHRPALLAQSDHYLAAADVPGWLAALAASGAVSPSDAVALAERTPEADRILDGLTAARIPLVSPEGVPIHARKELADATRAVLRDGVLGAGPRPVHLNGHCRIVALGSVSEVDTGPYASHVLVVADPAEARRKRLNTALDEFEYACLLGLTEENERVLASARARRVLPSTVHAYLNSDEAVAGFGQGGSESMTVFVRKDGERHVTVRKILSEALTTARWNPDGDGVMLPPFTKARKQAEFLRALPDPVRGYFPEVFSVCEREVPARLGDRAVDREVIYEMSYVAGEEVSRYVEKHTPPPVVVARLYEQIIRVLNDEVHSVGRVPAPGETLEVSYLRKIEDRLDLCRRTAPRTFGPDLLDTERIVIDGVSYLNHSALLKRFRETPQFHAVLEPAFHSLVMGDTNTENIKITHTEPLRRAQRLVESGAPQEDIDAALAAITPAALGIRFLDPRAIGFKSDGAETRDDPMYDNKPWHNSIGHYDEIHFEQFAMTVDAGAGRTPSVDIAFSAGNPYQRAYRVRDVTAGGGRVDPVAPQGMEDFFAPVMTAALRLDDPESPYLRDDPYWLIRFVFLMGQHFTAMPPFHFQKELDGTLVDSHRTQRRPVAIYCQGVKWLNWALELLEGSRTEFLGIAAPAVPHATS
ncbi:ACP S-malonyltransferase [Amycolatopsis sp. NPDC098790]|uniref:ACP S-malonyltransferase n=1 Tax=Amycolatopsis sp. NPDC098790 TaxID=3363939 RepID=UPI003819AB67